MGRGGGSLSSHRILCSIWNFLKEWDGGGRVDQIIFSILGSGFNLDIISFYLLLCIKGESS